MESENGCGVYSEKTRYTIDGLCFNTCVCGFRTHRLGFYISLLDKYEKGIMPFEGCLIDQPSKVVEILDRLSYIKNDIFLRQQKEINKNG